MKTLIYTLVSAIFMFILSACSDSNAPEVWGLKLGETRADVIKSVKSRGFDIDPTSSKVVRIIANIPYREITWNEIECAFDLQDKLEVITFTAYEDVQQSSIDKLSKYILADGFISIYDKEVIRESLMRGDESVLYIPTDDRFEKVPYMAIVKSDKLLSSHPVTTMTYSTIEYMDKKEAANADIRERLERGEEVTIEIDFGK